MKKINLVGHDWGAAVSWMTATLYPEILKKMVILNVPYPTLLTGSWRSFDSEQIYKSWYIFFFQLPNLPEERLSKNDFASPTEILRSSNNPNAFTDEDIQQYKGAWSQPNAIKSMLNWYRALIQLALEAAEPSWKNPKITTPTLVLWGENDTALEKALVQPSVDLCENGQVVFLSKCNSLGTTRRS